MCTFKSFQEFAAQFPEEWIESPIDKDVYAKVEPLLRSLGYRHETAVQFFMEYIAGLVDEYQELQRRDMCPEQILAVISQRSVEAMCQKKPNSEQQPI